MYGNRSMVRTPFAGGVPFVPLWEELPSGYGEGCGCACTDHCDGGERSQRSAPQRGGARSGSGVRSPGARGGLTGAFDGSAGLGGDLGGLTPGYSGSGGPLAVLDTPPMKPIGDGTGGKGGGGGGGTPEDVAETEAHNDFLLGLGDAVAEGGDAAMDFAVDYLGDDLSVDTKPRVVADCDRFDPPVDGLCPLAADTSDCFPPCVYPVSDVLCTVDALPMDGIDRKVTVVDLSIGIVPGTSITDTSDMTLVYDLLRWAWAVLVANEDIVEWVACQFYGEDANDSGWEAIEGVFGFSGSVAECLVRSIEGDPGYGITLRIFDGLVDGAFQTSKNTSDINVSLVVFADNCMFPYVEAGLDAAQQFCIVVDLAGSLLHELVHTCRKGGDRDSPVDAIAVGDHADGCSTTYLIENAFRWAMGERYPCLAATDGCCYYVSPDLWRNSGASYPGAPPTGVACPSPWRPALIDITPIR